MKNEDLTRLAFSFLPHDAGSSKRAITPQGVRPSFRPSVSLFCNVDVAVRLGRYVPFTRLCN